MDNQSLYTRILDCTTRAYATAENGAAKVADYLAGRSETCRGDVEAIEDELDQLDREVDALIPAAMAEVTPAQAQELFAAAKMLIDLERIGDLFASVVGYARALRERLGMEDIGDLVKMATAIEQMLANAHGASATRNVDRALAVLRADSEVDRIRNLILIRHLEQAQTQCPQNSVQVLFMAQALERAGDHVKNLAEEICHLATGQSIRHLLRGKRKASEQLYLDYLRTRHGLRTQETAEAEITFDRRSAANARQ